MSETETAIFNIARALKANALFKAAFQLRKLGRELRELFSKMLLSNSVIESCCQW